LVTYRQTRNQRIREQKRKVSLKRRQKAIGAALAGSLATALLFGMGQKKTEAEGAVYTVSKGDTLYSLSKKFNTSVELLKGINSLDRYTIHIGQKIQIPVVSEENEAGTYIVKKGDTLYSVAKKYGVTVKALMEENHLNKETIFTGQTLIVPTHYHQAGEGTYTVEPGDTLWNIAMRYGVSLKELKDTNHLKENMVLIGQRLTIPGDIDVMEATVAGAADNFTVEFTQNGHAIPLKVAYGTARKYQKLAGKTLLVTYKNGAVIQID
jgi:LysM repeat protein